MSTRAGGQAVVVLGRDRALLWTGLVGLTVGAWLYLLHLAGEMPDSGMLGMGPALVPWTVADVAFTVAMWAVMMVGMMLPAASPVILLFAAVSRKRREQTGVAVPATVFVLGYLVVWSAFSVGAAAAQWGLQRAAALSPALAATSPVLSGVLLLAAGLYQFTPLKTVCLARCRSPIGWLMTEWREGVTGALHMGLRHGAYCLGCCWVLMGLLFVTGVMNLLWVAAIAAFILVEKVAPGGALISRVASLGLVAVGVLMLLRAIPPLGM